MEFHLKKPLSYDIDKEIGVGIMLGGLAGLERVI